MGSAAQKGFLYKDYWGGPTLTLLNVLGVLDVLDVLNKLNMPKAHMKFLC